MIVALTRARSRQRKGRIEDRGGLTTLSPGPTGPRPPHESILVRRGAAAALIALGALSLAATGASPPARRWSTVERLSDQRLAAAHEAADALREATSRPAPFPGLTDYRAIFHAHASDSDHTGGTLDELLADAARAEVKIVFLSDHPRPPRDFMRSWRGVRNGVLFVPGAETASGYLLHPERSIMERIEGPPAELLAATTEGAGLAFVSHLEDHEEPVFEGVTGMEIYNRHADSKDDAASMLALVEWMTDPSGVVRLRNAISRHPVEVYAAQQDYPEDYLAIWDRETAAGRRLVGVAANDCHHNQVFVVKKVDDTSVRVGTVVDSDDEMRVFTTATRPRLGEMTRLHDPGDVVARLDFDPYWVSMRYVSTHVLASALEEAAVREAVEAGRVYVSHDWIADPSGFRFFAAAGDGGPRHLMGDEAAWQPGLRLIAELPLAARVRLLRDGVEVRAEQAARLEHVAEEPGVYRVEAWVEIDGEPRPWIYANPIYLRGAPSTGAGE
jgi:hypothetical protein